MSSHLASIGLPTPTAPIKGMKRRATDDAGDAPPRKKRARAQATAGRVSAPNQPAQSKKPRTRKLAKIPKDSIPFQRFPTEICLRIFDHMTVGTLDNIRHVNDGCKSAVDAIKMDNQPVLSYVENQSPNIKYALRSYGLSTGLCPHEVHELLTNKRCSRCSEAADRLDLFTSKWVCGDCLNNRRELDVVQVAALERKYPEARQRLRLLPTIMLTPGELNPSMIPGGRRMRLVNLGMAHEACGGAENDLMSFRDIVERKNILNGNYAVAM